MAQLLVRGLDEETVEALKERAREHGCSVEEEHRRVLKYALKGPKKISFEEYLGTMPNVGEDEDFSRGEAVPRDYELSD